MAKKVSTTFLSISQDTIIEVISIKGSKVYKKQMSYGDAIKMTKLKGWRYIYYQIGVSQFKEAKTL